jgi:hypothetical protein
MFFFFDSVQVVFTICTAGNLAASLLKGIKIVMYVPCHVSSLSVARVFKKARDWKTQEL